MEKWIDVVFASDSVKTEQYRKFTQELKSYIVKKVKPDFDLAKWNEGHFYVSGFLKHRQTGKYVYFSCSDVRFFKGGWYRDLLIRTAEHDSDYTGGSNETSTLPDLNERAKTLVLGKDYKNIER